MKITVTMIKKLFDENESDLLLSQLPKSKGWSINKFALFQAFWIPKSFIPKVLTFQSQFEPHDGDIFLAALPKSGATWLKAIAFSVANRRRYSLSDTPLLTVNPHELVPYVEFETTSQVTPADPTSAGGGRLWSTHLPYGSLADSVKRSPCRIVYVVRNPLDVVVSALHFSISDMWTTEEYVDAFCRGEAHMFGPYWSHLLGYWKESLERPEKVLFLKYEELKEDAVVQVKRIAEFMRFGFSEEEVTRGVVEEIVELCSLESLKNLEVNKSGKLFSRQENKNFFRKVLLIAFCLE